MRGRGREKEGREERRKGTGGRSEAKGESCTATQNKGAEAGRDAHVPVEHGD